MDLDLDECVSIRLYAVGYVDMYVYKYLCSKRLPAIKALLETVNLTRINGALFALAVCGVLRGAGGSSTPASGWLLLLHTSWSRRGVAARARGAVRGAGMALPWRCPA